MEADKYKDICDEVKERTGAEAAFIVVIKGERGSGISHALSDDFTDLIKAAEMFETLAAELRNTKGGNETLN